MEDSKVKKEIIVKRLSAFKFEVEVNTQEHQPIPPARVSVIQKAPPASNIPRQTSLHNSSKVEPIEYVIACRIVELLLWKMMGEHRLRYYCGYPTVTPCVLLRKVVNLSTAKQGSSPLEEHACKENMECFLEHLSRFLNVIAPTKEEWNKFGWNGLSEEAILRKIFREELQPHLHPVDLERDPYITRIFSDTQKLLELELQGCISVLCHKDKSFCALLPENDLRREKRNDNEGHVIPEPPIDTLGKTHTLGRPTENGWRVARFPHQRAIHESRFIQRHRFNPGGYYQGLWRRHHRMLAYSQKHHQ